MGMTVDRAPESDREPAENVRPPDAEGLAFFDGRLGQGYSGLPPGDVHIDVVVARRGSPSAAAVASALAVPTPGTVPYVACLGTSVAVRPVTVVVNRSSIDEPHQRLFYWGAGQLGIAQGVLDAVHAGVIPAPLASDLVLLASGWINPAAFDETALRRTCRDAMRAAIEDAVLARRPETILALANERDGAGNRFYSGA